MAAVSQNQVLLHPSRSSSPFRLLSGTILHDNTPNLVAVEAITLQSNPPAAAPQLALDLDEVLSETNGSRTLSGVIKPSSKPGSGNVRTSQSYKKEKKNTPSSSPLPLHSVLPSSFPISASAAIKLIIPAKSSPSVSEPASIEIPNTRVLTIMSSPDEDNKSNNTQVSSNSPILITQSQLFKTVFS
ncbi:hypothetical protein L1887_00460 [Cichorium endivia]|nr:hypothetical protein L1887_00460 [Cichorium endivia]